MLRRLTVSTAVLLCAFAATAIAQHTHTGHMAMSVPDGREVVQFPPEMQANFLRNMRDCAFWRSRPPFLIEVGHPF